MNILAIDPAARTGYAHTNGVRGVMISFTVYGEAKPAGSKRAFALKRRDGSPVLRPNGSQVVTVIDDCAKSRDWKQQVAHAAREEFQADLLDGPLKLTLRFYRPRPKGHYGANGLNGKGRTAVAPTTKPDVLKLARAVEDALTSVVWRDDAQVCVEVLVKQWGEPARVEVTIEAITESDIIKRAEQVSHHLPALTTSLLT